MGGCCSAESEAVTLAAGWRITEQEHSSRALCACLDLAAPLVCAVINTAAHPSEPIGHTKSDAERFGYIALSALICAAQIKSAWALHESHGSEVCRAESFHCFWPCAAARSEVCPFVMHPYVQAICIPWACNCWRVADYLGPVMS